MDNHVRILMAAYPFPPYKWVPGASIRLVKFLKYMARQRPEWKVDVVTAGYGPAERSLPRYADDLLAEVPESVRVFRVTDPAYSTATALSIWSRGSHYARRIAARLLRHVPAIADHWRSFAKREAVEAIPDPQVSWNSAVLRWLAEHSAEERYDLVYVSCPPYSTAVLGVQIKEQLGTLLIVDIKDDWNPQQRPYAAERRAREQALEHRVIQTADEVILVTPASLENYRQRYSNYSHFNLVTNGVDLEDYADIDLCAIRPSMFKVTYAGSLGRHNRSPANFFKAFQRLLHDPDVDANACLACFPIHMNPDFWRAVSEMGLDHWVKSVPILPMDQFKRHLAESCVLLSINYYGETTLVPGKLYEYWAVGRPILLIEKPGAATELVREYDLGLTADPDDVDGIYRALRSLYQDYSGGRCKRSNREGLVRFSREDLTRRLCSIIERHLHPDFSEGEGDRMSRLERIEEQS